jgi:hypothetical protein
MDKILVSDIAAYCDNCGKADCTSEKGDKQRSSGKIGKKEPIYF